MGDIAKILISHLDGVEEVLPLRLVGELEHGLADEFRGAVCRKGGTRGTEGGGGREEGGDGGGREGREVRDKGGR